MNLDAVRGAVLADADDDAAELRAAAERDVATAVAAARVEADHIVAEARSEGDAEARRVAVLEGARARRRAREEVLAARNAAYVRLLRESQETAVALRRDRRYPELIEALTRVALTQLGDAATVRRDDEHGGIVATAGSRTLDYRLDAMAVRNVAALGERIEDLWR